MAETPAAVVLVGSSLTEASDPVVRAALALTRARRATLHLAHAVPYPVELFDSTMLSDRVLEELREKERAALMQELTAQAERVGVTADELHGLTVEAGEPHRVLIDLARKLPAALVVVGAAEAEGRITRAFGSTSGRVVRKTDCPVLVARGELPVPPARVLLPVDLSPLSLEVARQALAFLDGIRGAAEPEVEALFVVGEREDRMLRASSDGEEEAAAVARRHLDRFLGTCCTGSALRPTGTVAEGVPADEIVHRAEETRPDLVVVGTHGRSGFERLMIGSVAADVVRSVPTSVLVIPPATAD
jgi:nucleotide-binding universal stress UspA family protein